MISLAQVVKSAIENIDYNKHFLEIVFISCIHSATKAVFGSEIALQLARRADQYAFPCLPIFFHSGREPPRYL